MSMPTGRDAIIAELQLLRLNILPSYTYDNDEGQRSSEEYVGFYRGIIDASIYALDRYIESFRDVIADPQSDGTFSQYLDARARFVASIPFCEDALPADRPQGRGQYVAFLRSQFEAKRIKSSDVNSLCRYQTLLYWLRENLGSEE